MYTELNTWLVVNAQTIGRRGQLGQQAAGDELNGPVQTSTNH